MCLEICSVNNFVIDFSNFYIKEIQQFAVKKKCKFHCFYLYSQYMCLLVITKFFITIKSCQGFVQNFAKEFHYILDFTICVFKF